MARRRRRKVQLQGNVRNRRARILRVERIFSVHARSSGRNGVFTSERSNIET